MGKLSQQQRSRRRMTLYNKAKSAEKVQAKESEIEILKLDISEVIDENIKLKINVIESNQEKQIYRLRILKLESDLSGHIGHHNTLNILKREISSVKGHYFLKYEKLHLKYAQKLDEEETKFHNSILEITQENETLKRKIILLENELLKLNKSSLYLPDKQLEKI